MFFLRFSRLPSNVSGDAADDRPVAGDRPHEHVLDLITALEATLDSLRHAQAIEGERADRLTPRELEVLRLVAEGNTSREISARLGVSNESVATALRRAREKLEGVQVGP